MNIFQCGKAYIMPFTFPTATLNGGWGRWDEDLNTYVAENGKITCDITVIAKHEDIDGEGWMNVVQNNAGGSTNEMYNNRGYTIELRGVNIRIDVSVSYFYQITNTNNEILEERSWNKIYYNCMSNISRADLNYFNVKKDAILKADYGKGEPLIFDLIFDEGTIELRPEGYFNGGCGGSMQYPSDIPAYYPQIFSVNTKWTKEQTEMITHDIKKELVVGGGISNGYIGLADIARQAQKFYIGIDNVAREIQSIYIGDKDGKARLFFAAGGGSIDLPLELFNYKVLSEDEIGINYPFGPNWLEAFPSGNVSFAYYYFPEEIEGKKAIYSKDYF
jgi:hypothetical protein